MNLNLEDPDENVTFKYSNRIKYKYIYYWLEWKHLNVEFKTIVEVYINSPFLEIIILCSFGYRTNHFCPVSWIISLTCLVNILNLVKPFTCTLNSILQNNL